MHLYLPKLPVRVAIGCSVLALAFQFVAVVGTGWLVESYPYTIEEGLFRVCDRSDGRCSAYGDNVKDWAKACQAFSILALGAIFSSFVVGILHILREETQRLTLLGAGVNVLATVYVAAEVGVFAAKTTSLKAFYGYGFYLSVVAGVLSVVTVILYLVGRVTTRQ